MTTIPADETGVVPAPRRRRRVHTLDTRIAMLNIAFALLLLGGVIAIVVVPWPNRAVILPTVALTYMAGWYIWVIYRRDRELPIFELGSLWVAASYMYSAYPLINFIAGGFAWNGSISDFRLRAYGDDPVIMGTFAWRYVLYYFCFVTIYVWRRGRWKVSSQEVIRPNRSEIASILILFSASLLLLTGVARAYGIEYDASYKDILSGESKTIIALPYVLLQFIQNFMSARFLLTQLLVAVGLIFWYKRWCRYLLISGFVIHVVYTTLNRGARGELILLILTAILLYHRFVRPLTLKIVVPLGVGVLFFFFLLGIIRDVQGLSSLEKRNVSVLATTNEFQAVFGTSFHVLVMKNDGSIGEIPWQLRWADLYYLVPSQFLPFEKIDPSAWYLHVAHIEGVGFMYGAISEAILGGDWIELAIRGVVLGWLSAFVHRWYVRRSKRFWPCMFYLFLCVWMFYSMRATGFSVLYRIVYTFIPTLICVEAVAWTLRRTRKQAIRVTRGI